MQADIGGTLSQREFLGAAWESITRLYGEHGASLTGLSLIRYDETKKIAVVRVALKALQSVRASLALITMIGDREVAVNVIAVAGTVRSLPDTQ